MHASIFPAIGFPAIGLLAICVELPGQITQSLQVLTPITATATSGSVVQSQAQPAGVIVDNGNVAASALDTDALIAWFGGASTIESLLTLRHELSVPMNSGGASLAQVGGDILIVYTAPVSTPVRLDVSIEMSMPAGATAPSLNVDISNNGIIDVSSGNPTGGGHFVIGPQPFAVRIQSAADLGIDGDMIASIHVRMTPSNQLSITPVALGCQVPGLFIYPSFLGTGIVARPWDVFPSSGPSVLVLGLQSQPALLGASSTCCGLPCLLMPRPDFVVTMINSSFELAIPAAVRPINIVTQRVGLFFGDLFTTAAFSINAH